MLLSLYAKKKSMKKIYLFAIFAIYMQKSSAQTVLYTNNFSNASGTTTNSVQTIPTTDGTVSNFVDNSPLSTIIGLNATGYTNFNWNIANSGTSVNTSSILAPTTISYTGASAGKYAVCYGQSSATTQYGAIVIGPLNTIGYNNLILNFGMAYNVPDTVVRGAATGFTGYGTIAIWSNRRGAAQQTSPRVAPVTTAAYINSTDGTAYTAIPFQSYLFSGGNGRPSGSNSGTYIPSGSWKMTSISLPDSSNSYKDSLYITISISTGTKTINNVIMGFDDITITGTPTPLPVSLAYFNGKVTGGNASLKWQSVSEINTDHYDVEASVDNKTWAKVATVNAVGSNNNYNASVSLQKNTFFRLKMVDKDGSSSYSNQILLATNSESTAIKLLNSVATNSVGVLLNATIPTTYQLSLYTTEGKTITSAIYNNTGSKSYNLQVPANAPRGMAILKVSDGTTIQSFKVFLQ